MSLADRPLVSIIVPVYNVERYLDECLESIRGQTYDRLEILVVEDCSTDDSSARLEQHLCDSRVRVIQHVRNSGLSAARNTGIEAVQGAYVLFVDSDDVIAPGLVDACLAKVNQSGVDVVVFDSLAFKDGESLPEVGARSVLCAGQPIDRLDYFELPHFAWLKFIRADLLRDPSLRFPVGYYYEDWPFHWALGFSTASILMLEGGWYYYRQRATSITASTGARLLDQLRVQLLVLEMVSRRGGIPEARALSAKAHSSAWNVLMRVDRSFLPRALRQTEILFKGLRSVKGRPLLGRRRYLLAAMTTPFHNINLVSVRIVRALRRGYKSVTSIR